MGKKERKYKNEQKPAFIDSPAFVHIESVSDHEDEDEDVPPLTDSPASSGPRVDLEPSPDVDNEVDKPDRPDRPKPEKPEKPVKQEKHKQQQKKTVGFNKQLEEDPPVQGLDPLISDLPKQRRDIVSRKGGVFTLMVAGESGLGKTTFINTLFSDPLTASKPRDKSKLYDKGRLDYYDKTTSIDIQDAEYEEDGFKMKFTVIDTPGFGDYTNNKNAWVPIVNYIDEQHRMYMLREEQPDRSEIVDTRVHACLYFIRPSGHGLLPLDIQVMRELSTRVNLIPVLAKADSFTLGDRHYFKQQVIDAVLDNNIQIFNPPDDNHALQSYMPFAIISSEQWVMNAEGTHKVRGRSYRWGVAEVENPNHCDFTLLQNVLMTTHMLDLIDNTVDHHYANYRTNTLLLRLARAAAVADGNNSAEPDYEADMLMTKYPTGIDALNAVAAFGREFLAAGIVDTDPIYRDKVAKCGERFDVVVSFQEKKFDQWRNELKSRQDEYNKELESIHNEIVILQDELAAISGRNAAGNSNNAKGVSTTGSSSTKRHPDYYDSGNNAHTNNNGVLGGNSNGRAGRYNISKHL